ncbi:MAG: nucleotidyltransferase domain-containing protein [Dysgonamonadaceae bacterium]|jgi:predicted nucleotidyltransferase|nr:nucleotidyltransferase domain-containing protein [Dysgonamonadaceae bacterium]
MDKKSVVRIVKQYAKEVEKHYTFDKIWLFGSYAKGTNTDNSDIDVAVVFDDYDNSFLRQVELMKLSRKIDSRIEPHPFRKRDFTASNPLINEIVTYGNTI